MIKLYNKLAKICLGFILCIIVAGSVVRITGSGMGCPDWPKCFGYYIPPTDIAQLNFKANNAYKKGQVIIIDRVFHYAKDNFTSGKHIDLKNWEINQTHNYNNFNVKHTWIEFINRLLTAVAGIPVVLLFVISIFLFKKKPYLSVIAGLVIVLMGIAAWLGKTVVDSNLMPTKISMHLILAYLLVLTLTLAIYKSKWQRPKLIRFNNTFKRIIIVTFAVTVFQIVLGILVRQYVDEKIATLGLNKSLWLQTAPISFYIHRSFSIVLVLLVVWLVSENKKKPYHYNLINVLGVMVVIEVLVGIVMSNLDFPFLTQPIHLVSSAIILALLFFIILSTYTTRNISNK